MYLLTPLEGVKKVDLSEEIVDVQFNSSLCPRSGKTSWDKFMSSWVCNEREIDYFFFSLFCDFIKALKTPYPRTAVTSSNWTQAPVGQTSCFFPPVLFLSHCFNISRSSCLSRMCIVFCVNMSNLRAITEKSTHGTLFHDVTGPRQ